MVGSTRSRPRRWVLALLVVMVAFPVLGAAASPRAQLSKADPQRRGGQRHTQPGPENLLRLPDPLGVRARHLLQGSEPGDRACPRHVLALGPKARLEVSAGTGLRLHAAPQRAFLGRNDRHRASGEGLVRLHQPYYIQQYGLAAGGIAAFGVPLQSVETVGKWTVIVHLKSPNPTLTQDLWARNAAPKVSSPRCVANPDLFKRQSCGAGPYVIDYSQTLINDHVTLTPNPYYYDKSKQHWSKITVKVVSNASSLFQALEAGQLDLIEGDLTTVRAAKSAASPWPPSPERS